MSAAAANPAPAAPIRVAAGTTAGAAVRDAGLPIHLTLGNHDERERFWTALTDNNAAKRPVADRQVSLLRAGRANLFVLDTLEKTNSTPGILGQAQLDPVLRYH